MTSLAHDAKLAVRVAVVLGVLVAVEIVLVTALADPLLRLASIFAVGLGVSEFPIWTRMVLFGFSVAIYTTVILLLPAWTSVIVVRRYWEGDR